MRKKRTSFKALFLSFLFFLCFFPYANNMEISLEKEAQRRARNLRYLKYNIHAQEGPRDCKASYANWTSPGAGHFIIPVNTPVAFSSYRRGLIIVVLDPQFPVRRRRVFFEFNRLSMNMTADEYIDLITSFDKMSLTDFSEIDLEGISKGRVFLGMTKEGVMVALGYPAKHKTPYLDEKKWFYWKNRWQTFAVEFDENGIVVRILD